MGLGCSRGPTGDSTQLALTSQTTFPPTLVQQPLWVLLLQRRLHCLALDVLSLWILADCE